MDLDFVSVHKHAKKELGQYPAILTSHLVNNPYILRKLTVDIYSILKKYNQYNKGRNTKNTNCAKEKQRLSAQYKNESILASLGGLMVSALDSGASGAVSSPGRGYCVAFLGKTLYSQSASLHPGV